MKHTKYRYIILDNKDYNDTSLEERRLLHSKEEAKEVLLEVQEKDKRLREELYSIDIDIPPSQYSIYRLTRVKNL